METEKESEVLTLLQPDLLTADDLIRKLEAARGETGGAANAWSSVDADGEAQVFRYSAPPFQRCCKVQNLRAAPKERLVGIFRRVVLPLPQRFYRANRRGKMLAARRAKAGLEGGRKRGREEAGCSSGERERGSRDRLKPPPDVSSPRRIRLDSHGRDENSDEAGNRDRRRGQQEDSSGRKSPGKRPISDPQERPSAAAPKKQRVAIKWP